MRYINCSIHFLILIISLSAVSSCMMMGKHKSKKFAGSDKSNLKQSESVVIDQLILDAINDLSTMQELSIESLAVWKIETKSDVIDAENIRQKIISVLVNNTSYKVISREHLDKLLTEQSLSLSGTIDSTNANNIGELIGVEGFITGYISKQKDSTELSLSLIKTKSGEVVWATIQKR